MRFIRNEEHDAIFSDTDGLIVADGQPVHLDKRCTYYGYVGWGNFVHDNRVYRAGDYFSLTPGASYDSLVGFGRLMLAVKLDYIGMNQAGFGLEDEGRLQYIDGCRDTLLLSPPRKGDPCLNALYFPPGIDQTFHTHPSARIGYVAAGNGHACTPEGEFPLCQGDAFYLPAEERHRFRTSDSHMLVVAWHPDSDFGPEDESHPMINRTVINPTDQYTGMTKA